MPAPSQRDILRIARPIIAAWPHWRTNPEGKRCLRLRLTVALERAGVEREDVVDYVDLLLKHNGQRPPKRKKGA